MLELFPLHPNDQDQISFCGHTYVYHLNSDSWRTDVSEYVDPLPAPDMQLYTLINLPSDRTSSRQLWVVRGSMETAAAWEQIRMKRNRMIADFEWRYNRWNRQTRLGIPTIDDIAKLDAYLEALADITKQTDPANIEWPVYTD